MLTVARVTCSYTRDGKLISRKIEPIDDKNFIPNVVEIIGKMFMKHVENMDKTKIGENCE